MISRCTVLSTRAGLAQTTLYLDLNGDGTRSVPATLVVDLVEGNRHAVTNSLLIQGVMSPMDGGKELV